MKKHILTAMSLAMAAIMATADEPAMVRQLVIEDTDGVKTTFDTDKIDGIMFTEMPEYVKCNTFLAGVYSNESGLGKYIVDLGTSQPDENGDPVNQGDYQVRLELTGPACEDASNIILPEGYYTMGPSTTPFTFNMENSAVWIRVEPGAEGVTVMPVFGGSVDVRHADGGKYDIRMELNLLSGDQINLSFDGKMSFYFQSSEHSAFTEPVDITLDGLQGRFYANWFYPFADDITVNGYNGEFSGNNLKSGYWLNLPMFMPKVDDPEHAVPRLADGVYTIEKRERTNGNTFIPFTYQFGHTIDLMGAVYDTGAYLKYIDKDGTTKIGYFSDGTVTVSDNGTKVVVDCVDHNGISIKLTFSGTPNIQSFCDNQTQPERPWSTLTADCNLDFTANTVGIYYKDETIKEGLNSYTFWVVDSSMEKGDYMQFAVLTTGNGIADGTYTIATTFTDKTLLPGWVVYGSPYPYGSWYTDLDSTDSEGVQSVLAPTTSGTITVSTEGSQRKIVFNLKDDNGHTIKGEYKGDIIDGETEVQAKAMKSRFSNNMPRLSK